MINLYNGRGQLGLELVKYCDLDIDCDIYHTWNFLDKEFNTQKKEYAKYCEFLKKRDKSKLLYFISTKSLSNNYYTYFKELAEIKTVEFNGTVIKIPNLIGKGFCDALIQKNEPFGVVEVLTIEECSKKIVKLINSRSNKKTQEVKGELISAKTIYNILQYGKNN